jgi:predicted Fe-Mo cluster-binding NifX family protein
MKIAIAATSSDSEAQIAMQGARAPYYLIFNTEDGVIEAFSNPASEIDRGAGPEATAFLVSKGVSKLVAGEFGHKFHAALEDNDIACIEKGGVVTEIITELR